MMIHWRLAGIIFCLICVGMVGFIRHEFHQAEAQALSLNQTIANSAGADVEALRNEVSSLKSTIKDMTLDCSHMGTDWKPIRMRVTAYHESVPSVDPMYIDGQTASGTDYVGRGVVAVDPKHYPRGTEFCVPEWGRGTAQDTGNAIKGPRRIDVGMHSHHEAVVWGSRKLVVYVRRGK